MEQSELVRRAFPEAEYDFLRCQLGMFAYERRRIGGMSETVTLFHLLGFGTTWDEAVTMAGMHPKLAASPETQTHLHPESLLLGMGGQD